MGDESLEMLPEDLITGRAIRPEMVRDLRVIAQLDARTVGRIGEHLSTAQGFAVQESVKEGVQSCLQDSSADFAESIVRTLLNLKPSEVTRTVKTVDRWRQSTEERKNLFTDELFASPGVTGSSLVSRTFSSSVTSRFVRTNQDVIDHGIAVDEVWG